MFDVILFLCHEHREVKLCDDWCTYREFSGLINYSGPIISLLQRLSMKIPHMLLFVLQIVMSPFQRQHRDEPFLTPTSWWALSNANIMMSRPSQRYITSWRAPVIQPLTVTLYQ